VPGEPGLWRQVLPHAAAGPERPALFLDRDGVVVAEVNYLHRIGDIAMLDGAVEAIAACNDAGVPVVMVTNQSGVGRNYYGWADFAAVQAEIERLIAPARLDMVLACGYHADAAPPYRREAHGWRKPNPGMLQEAAAALALDLARSWIVGDSAGDIAAGRNAGLAGGIHVLTGHGSRDREAALALAGTGFEVIPEPGIGSVLRLLGRLTDQVA
jgi:D-glycero-D-manno-heptose 1,7-bisphosphate phosphatase